MVTTITFVRHCETQANAALVFQGGIDAPLSHKGIFQLGLVAARLSNMHIDKIYSSPQPRAMKTAAAINGFHNVPVVEEPGLREIQVGEMDGMDCRQIAKHFPQIAHTWDEAPWDFASPGGETMAQVYERGVAAVQKIVAENQGKTLLVTAHGCLLRNVLCWCKGLTLREIEEIPLGQNTGVSTVEFYEDGSKAVTQLWDCSHLPIKAYHANHRLKICELAQMEAV